MDTYVELLLELHIIEHFYDVLTVILETNLALQLKPFHYTFFVFMVTMNKLQS